MKLTPLSTLLLLSIVAFTTACTTAPSLQQIATFGDASASLAQHAGKGLTLTQTTTVDRKLHEVAIDASTLPSDDDFVGPIGADDLKARRALFDQFGEYGDGLHILAAADFQSDVEAASRKLDSSLRKLSKQVAKTGSPTLSNERIGILVAAINAIGGTYAEAKKRAALKQIIVDADDTIQAVVKLIRGEFGPDGVLAARTKTNLQTQLTVLNAAYNIDRERPGSTFQSRRTHLEQIRGMRRRITGLDGFYPAVDKAAMQVGEAHAALKDAVSQDEFSTERVVTQVRALVDRAKDVKSFYDAIN
ncbi:MAG: hypothetical protein AAF493_19695 [Pseudomonadota bacterium]